MSKTPKKQNKELAKKEDKKAEIEKVRKGLTDVRNNSINFFDANSKIEEFNDLQNKKELTAKEKKRKDKLGLELATVYGLRNGIWVGHLSHISNSGFLSTTRNDFIKEYDCKTSLELMLTDRIIGNYWRSMRLDTVLNRLIEKEDGGYTFNEFTISIVRELSKSLESASRQLNANILLLKELKQPKLNVRVNTKNAFVGENQQFNVNKQDNQKQDENIEPK